MIVIYALLVFSSLSDNDFVTHIMLKIFPLFTVYCLVLGHNKEIFKKLMTIPSLIYRRLSEGDPVQLTVHENPSGHVLFIICHASQSHKPKMIENYLIDFLFIPS